VCQHDGKSGFDAVDCRLVGMQDAINGAAPGAIKGGVLKRKLLAKIHQLQGLADKGRAGGKSGVNALKKATRQMSALVHMIDKLGRKNKLDGGLARKLVDLGRGAGSELQQRLKDLKRS